MSVQFALTAAPLREDGGFVFRPGKYFEIGKTFTDRAGIEFGISRTEAEVAVASFQPANLNIEHEPSVLDGLLGRVERLWIDGDDIMAEYALPKWLHEATAGQEIATSSEWDINAKSAGGAALVLKPALKDAAIHAAFKANPEAEQQQSEAIKALFERHNTPTGQMAIQDVHDATARAGAVCDKGNTAKMAARHEMTALQAMHEMATEHGAKCQSGDHPYRSMSMFSEKTPARPVHHTQGNEKMTFFEKIRAAFKTAGVPDDQIPQFTDADLPKQTAQFSDAQIAEFTAQRAEFANFKAASLKKDASAFVASLIEKGQILPYEKPLIEAQFAQAIADDAGAGGTVKFSALNDDLKPVEKTGTRFDALQASLAARMPTGMTSELTGGGRVTEADFKALFSRESTKETPEQKAARIDKSVDDELAAHGITKK